MTADEARGNRSKWIGGVVAAGSFAALVLGIGLLVIYPHVVVRQAVARSLWTRPQWKKAPPREIKELGGEQQALRRLRSYIDLPDWFAPNKLQAMALMTQCGEAGCREVFKLAEGKDEKRAAQALEALTWTGDPRTLGFFAERLKASQDANVRMMAASALGRIDDAKAVWLLAEVLAKDADHNVRKNAVLSLGLKKDAASLEVLQVALQDRSVWVRRHAREELTRRKAAPPPKTK